MTGKRDDVLDPTWVYRYLDLGAGGAALILHVACYVLTVVAFGWGLALSFLASLPILVLTPAAMVLLLIRLVGERNRPPAWRHAARAGLLVLLTWAVGFFFVAPGGLLKPFLADRGFRRELEAEVNLQSLQKWATDLLQKPPDEAWTGEPEMLPRDALPEDLRNAGPSAVFVQRGEGPEYNHMQIGFGGGFYHWGIMVGPPAFEPAHGGRYWVYRWQDGVYGYQEG
jgi:hypothetical protein